MEKRYIVGKTTPIIFWDEIRKSYEEIVFSGGKDVLYELESVRDYILVDHSDYRQSGMVFRELEKYVIPTGKTFYAFGLRVNPFYSCFVPIDIDHADINKVIQQMDKLIELPEVTAIDIIESSKTPFQINLHLHIALCAYTDIRSFISTCPFICMGYSLCMNRYHENVLRVSQKFSNDHSGYPIAFHTGYRKDNEKISIYKHFELPITSNACEPEKAIKKERLNIRGKLWPEQQHQEKKKAEDSKEASYLPF